ncbi:MAG: hypothetical protein EBY21_14480, partial [Alphaproteobacteria bacterium]|nr:hypothetical protein [Alphaproteobacteria bacterium]
ERIALAAGEKYNLDPSLIKHVMFKETGNLKDKATAVSPAGAMGVMQLMPATARELGVKDPFDPVQNIEGGVKYLAKMQRKYDDPKIAAIAYNWGPGHTDRWLAQGGDFSKLPKETQGYIKGLAGGGRPEDMDGTTVDVSGDDYRDIPDVVSQYVEPFGAPDYTTEDSGIKNILKQKVQVGKPYTPGIGEITGYEIVPSTKGYDRAKSQGLGKPVPKNLPEPKPLPKPVEKAAEPEVAGPRSYATEDSLREALDALNEPSKATEEKPTAAAPAAHDDLKEYFTKGIESLADQKKINAYMSLLSAGLGMMGGTSPYAMTNIGQGAQAGIQAYQAGNKDIAAQQAALMQGRLGLEKYQSLRDIQKQQMQNLQEFRESEKQRKIDASNQAAQLRGQSIQSLEMARAEKLMEMQRRNFETQAISAVEKKWKGNFALQTPEGRAEYEAELQAAKNAAHLQLMQDPTYRTIHKRVVGVDPLDLMPKQPAPQAGKPAVQNW